MVDTSAVAPNGNMATSRNFAIIVLGGILFACAAQASHWQPARYGDDSLGSALTPHLALPVAAVRDNLHIGALAALTRSQALDDAWPVMPARRHWDNRLNVEHMGSTMGNHSIPSSFAPESLGLNINKGIDRGYFTRIEHNQNQRAQTDIEQAIWNSAFAQDTELYIPPEFSYHPIIKNKTCRVRLRCGAAFYSDTRPDAYMNRNQNAFQRRGLVADRGTQN